MDAPQPPPSIFGRYSLLSRLAVGGMAELFLAKDSGADKLVVIKRIHPYLCQEERIVGMFLDEAKIAAQLQHPNVIRILELGQVDGSLFIAMEYVEGVDLWQLCEEVGKEGRTLSFEIAALVGAGVCAGLEHAHSRKDRNGLPLNIVHRDVNPMNVMVGFDGSVKLVDFGIAKARTMIEETVPGTIKGKYHYFSPEQVTEAPVDQRTDIFAIGISLYEITTGKNPFFKPSIEAVLLAIRSETPGPLTLLRPDYPPELSAIISRCLVKDPAQRYQRAAEVQADLLKYLNLPDERSGARMLSQYMATAFRRGEDETLPYIPVSLRQAAVGEVMAIPALRGRNGEQQASPGLRAAAEAFGRGLAGEREADRNTGAPLGTLPPTVRVGGAAAVLAESEDRGQTVPVPAPTRKRARGGRRAVRNGALALAGLLVAGAGIALLRPGLVPWLPGASETGARAEAEPAPTEADPNLAGPDSAGPNPAGPNAAGPNAAGPNAAGPNAAGPKAAGPNAAGPNAAGPNAAGPNVAAPSPPLPSELAPAFTRVAVKFNAPAGMRITRDGRHHLRGGAVEQLKPGAYRLVYRCPGKVRRKARYKALVLTVPSTSERLDVPLPCNR